MVLSTAPATSFPSVPVSQKALFRGLRIFHSINKSSKNFVAWDCSSRTAQHRRKIQLQCGLQVFLHPLQNRVPRGAGALWAPFSADRSGAENQVLLPLPPKWPPRLALNRHSWGPFLCFWLVDAVWFPLLMLNFGLYFRIWRHPFLLFPSATSSKEHQNLG